MTEEHPRAGWNLIDPAHAIGAFLNSLSTAPRLLGLGEPTHFVEDFPRARNRIFPALVEAHGYRAIALESDILAGIEPDAYVANGTGNLDDVLKRGFSHDFGKISANRELLDWLRSYNAGRDEADRVRFYGFDAPLETMWASSPKRPLLALYDFLAERLPDLPKDRSRLEALCGDNARWTNERTGMNPAQSIGASEDARTLRWLTDDLATRLITERPRLEEPADPFWHARLWAQTAQGLLRYHAVMAEREPERVAHMLSLRDRMMADNLELIAEREAERGPVLVFAHNQHLQRHNARWTYGNMDFSWVPAGVHVSRRMGERYAVIAATSGSGAGLPEPAPDTLEAWLNIGAATPRLYATTSLAPALPPTLERRADTAGNPGYSPLSPAHLRRTDGLLYLPTLTS